MPSLAERWERERIARLDALRSFNFWQRTLKDIEKRGGPWAVSLAKLAWATPSAAGH